MRNFLQNLKNLTLVTLLLLGSNNAWGYYSAKMNVYSSPSTGGYVYVGNSSSCSASSCGTKTSDNASSGNKGKIYNLSGNITFYLCNNPKSGYVFKGWAESESSNSGSGVSDNPWSQTVTGTSLNPTFNYYAIFARLTAEKSSLSFGEENVDQGWGNAQSVSVTYVHAGNVTATISGTNADDFSFANNAKSHSTAVVSNNTNSEASSTITIYFNPQCNGDRTATLTISSSNGLTSQTVSLSGTGVLNPQSLSWDNESDIELNMQYGSTQPLSATSTSGLAVTYTSSNNSIIYRNNSGLLEARGIGTATITVSQDGDCKYSAATSITKTFTISSKETPIFTPNGFSAGSTHSMKVGDKVTMEVEHVSDGLAGDFRATSTKANGLDVLKFTREGNIVTIEAINAGNTTATFTQKENSSIKGATQSYSFSVSKHQTSFSGSAYTFMVDGDETADYIYTNVSADQPTSNINDDFYYTIDNVVFANGAKNKGKNLVTFDPSTKRITACNAGTAKITLHQKETYKYTGATQSFKVAVYKYNSVFSGVADMSVKVEESKNSGYVLTYTKPDANYIGAANHTAGAPTLGSSSGDWYYTVSQTVTTSNTTGSADANKSVEYVANSKTVTGKNEGTATIHLYQTETYKYNAADTKFDIEISKNVPVFTWNGQNKKYYHNTEISNIFSTNNANCAYTIGKSSDTLVARVDGNTLKILTKDGSSASFTVTQQENYKWKFHQETFSVTPISQDNHVPLTYSQTMYNQGSITTQKESSSWDNSNQVHFEGGAFNWSDKYIVIHFTGIPDKVSFQYKASSGSATGAEWFVQESTNGSSWSDVWTNESNSTSWATVSNKQLATTTRYLKFCYSGNFDGYFKNIKVTELKTFAPKPDTLDFGALDINTTGPATQKTFNFNYANAGHNVTLTTNDSHFSVSPASIANIGGEKVGQVPVTVNYSTAEAHTATNAKLTIKDELNNSTTVTLIGEIKKLEPTVEWSSNDEIFNADDVLSASNSNGLTVTLSSAGNESYVNCSGNTATMLAATSGKITITAHVTGNDIYADKDITKEISITELEKQYITWTQDLSRLKTTDATKSVVLTATSSSGLPVTYELQGDKTGLTLTQNGNTWTLTYLAQECKNTTIIAKQAGNSTYAPASNVSMPVKVIDPTKVCDESTVLVNSQVSIKAPNLWTPASVTYNIDIPASMTVSFSRMKTGLLDAYLSGVDVEFYSDRNGTGDVLYTKSYSADDINKSLSNSNIDLTSYIHAKSVKITTSATNGYYINSVSYAHRKYCDLSSNSLNFNTYPNTETSPLNFTVSYANYPISLECNNSKFDFNPKSFGDCIEYGTQTISVTYTAGSSEGTDSGILYIKDNTGKTLGTVNLSVSITQVDQSIKSHNIQQAYKTTDKVVLTAETNSNLSNFTFTASPSDVVGVKGNEMIFSKSGTISVTISEPGNNVYRQTSTTVNNIVVSKDEPSIATAPTATSIQYMQTFRSSTLSDGVAEVTLRGVEHTPVEGSFAWTNIDYQVVETAAEHNYSVTFTPTNGNMYTAKEFTIPVTILCAPQSLEMTNGSVQARVLGLNESASESQIDLNSLIVKKTTDPFEASRAGAIIYEVISDNKGYATINGTIFSASICGEYTIRAKQVQTDYYAEATDEFVVTVNRLTPAISNSSNKNLKVDDTQDNAFSIVGGKDLIAHITIESISDINNGDGQVIEYDHVHNRIIAHNAGVAKIYLEQQETNTIAAYNSPVYTYTVSKYSNSISNTWAGAKTVNFNEESAISFTTTNKDYTNSPLKIEESAADSLIAIMTAVNATSFTTKAFYNVGTATLRVTQPESYKYHSVAQNIYLTVEELSTNCYVFEDYSEHSFTTSISDFSGHYEIGDDAFDVYGRPVDKISFQAKKDALGVNSSLTGERYFVVQYSVDNGANWRTLGTPDIGSTYQTFSYTFDDLQTDEKVSQIRFGARTGSTLTKYYKDIKITRKAWLQPIDASKTTLDTLRMPDNTIGSFTTAKFYVDYSTCDDVIKLASNSEHFTLSTNAISAQGDNQGSAIEVTVTYRNTKETADTATITLYTKYEHTTFTVVGRTYKKQQHIEWQNAFAERPLILPLGTEANNTNIAAKTTRPDGTVVYTTDNPDVIEIIMNGFGFIIIGDGEAKLSASSDGNDEWYPVSDTVTISTSSKLMQEIVWEQSFRNVGLEIGQDTVLEAKVYIRQPNGDLVFSQERTEQIVYTCPTENGVISLKQDTMTIVGYGKTTVTASVEGTDSYIEATSVTLTVKIGKQEEGCATPNVLNYTEIVKLESSISDVDWSHFTTPQVTAVLTLDASKGRPNMLSYSYNGQNSRFGCLGTTKVQQRINGQWEDVDNSLFENSEAFDWLDKDSLQLDERADAIQFIRLEGGLGTHSFKDITITLKHYLRPTESSLDLGEIYIGEKQERVVGIEYSDVKSELQVSKKCTDDLTMTYNDNDIDTIQCGAHGHFDLPISILPSKLGEWSDTILVADTITKDTISIIIKATVTPGSQYVFIEDGPWVYEEKWKDDKKPGAENSVLITANVFIPDTANISISSMTIQEGVNVTVYGTLNLGAVNSLTLTKYGNIHVADGGELNVGEGAFLANDFILDASLGDGGITKNSASGQVSEVERLYIQGDAYFQLKLNSTGTNTLGWYDFVVPFEVDINTGISIVDNDGVVHSAHYGEDYLVMRYDEAKRAVNGKDWIKYNGTMTPGRVYTIAVDADHPEWNTVRFKKSGTTIGAPATYQAECSTTGDAKDCGWNGIGNGTLQHMQLSDASVKIQVYDHENNIFVTRDETEVSHMKFAVGTSFFMQVDEVKPIEFTPATGGHVFLAPAREPRSVEEFRLSLTAEGATSFSDRLWVSASENAYADYTVGHDLLKMGEPDEAKTARMWAVRGDMRLCDIEMLMHNYSATCSINFQAPNEGTYVLAVENAPADATLYLTKDGRVMWNLSMSPYEIDLQQGKTEGYGLRIVANRQTPTGLENGASLNCEDGVRKVLIDDMIYVITPEGAMYDATGKKLQ